MKRILIVDDDTEFRSVVSDILREEGFLTTEAADGISALGHFMSCQHDAVILDHQMPHMSGVDTLRHIRQLCPGIPVIMVSGMMDSSVVRQAEAHGAVEFLSKPLEFGELVLRVRRVVTDV